MQLSKVKLTWKKFVLLVSLTLFFTKTVSSWLFPEVSISQEISAITMMLLLIQLSSVVPPMMRRYYKNRQDGLTFIKQVQALVPEKLVALFRLECSQQRAFLCWILRKKFLANEMSGETFSYHLRSQYQTFLAILIILCLTDLPISTLLISFVLDDPLLKMSFHVSLVVTTLYTIVWLIADRYAVNSTCHIVGKNSLCLRVGGRFDAEIPWSACEQVRPILQNKELRESRSAWLLKQGFVAAETIFCTPFDQPNVALIIRDPDSVYVEKYKLKRNEAKCILVYVDEPGKFIHSVHRNIQKRVEL